MPFIPFTPDTALVVNGFTYGLDHVGDQMLLDRRAGHNFLYLVSTSTSPLPASALYKVDRSLNAVVQTALILNATSALDSGKGGIPDIDTGALLYYVSPGGITNVFQPIGQFSVDSMTQLATANRDGFPPVGGFDPGSSTFYDASSNFRVDVLGTTNLLWAWKVAGATTDIKLRGFDRTTMVLQWVIDVPVDMGVSGGLIPDVDGDSSNNLWVLVKASSPDPYTVQLFNVSASGSFTLEADLTATFPDNSFMAMRWIPDENALLITAPDRIVKYSLGSHTVTATVLKTTMAPTGSLNARWMTSWATLHGPFENGALWFGYSYIGPNIPPDHITTPTQVIVRGVRFDIATMTITDTPEWYVPRSYFPLPDTSQFFDCVSCVFDANEYALWGGLNGSPLSIAKFPFILPTPGLRTTQLVAELVIRPHPPTGPVLPPPPLVFTEKNLVALTGPAQPMEVCSGYIGRPAVLSQLSQVEAHYNKDLAPLSSELHVFHTEQIGEADIQGRPGVIWKENPWFNTRQTDRYHRACLFCRGDTEVTALTWMLREAGIR